MATMPDDLIARILQQYGVGSPDGGYPQPSPTPPSPFVTSGGSAGTGLSISPPQRSDPRIGIFGNVARAQAMAGAAGGPNLGGNLPAVTRPDPQPNADITGNPPAGAGMFGDMRRQATSLADPMSPALAPDRTGIQQIANGMPKVRPHFFDKGGLGEKILHGLDEVALNYSASQGNPVALMKLRQRGADLDAQREQRIWQQRHDLARNEQLADRDYETNQPRYFSGGQDQLRFDPSTGKAETIYDAPTPAEAFAGNFGSPGSDEYRQAMSDYVLRGWGDTALDNRLQMESVRFGNRQALKQTPTYANLHPRAPAPRQPTVNSVIAGLLQKQNAGEPLSPGEQQTLSDYRSRAGGGGRAKGASTTSSVVKVSTPDEARRLPKGTMFQTPDGRIKVAS